MVEERHLSPFGGRTEDGGLILPVHKSAPNTRSVHKSARFRQLPVQKWGSLRKKGTMYCAPTGKFIVNPDCAKKRTQRAASLRQRNSFFALRAGFGATWQRINRLGPVIAIEEHVLRDVGRPVIVIVLACRMHLIRMRNAAFAQ